MFFAEISPAIFTEWQPRASLVVPNRVSDSPTQTSVVPPITLSAYILAQTNIPPTGPNVPPTGPGVPPVNVPPINEPTVPTPPISVPPVEPRVVVPPVEQPPFMQPPEIRPPEIRPPTYQPPGSILTIDLSRNWTVFSTRLPLTTRIDDLIILDGILPELGFLAEDMPDCSGGSCVLFSTQAPIGDANPGEFGVVGTPVTPINALPSTAANPGEPADAGPTAATAAASAAADPTANPGPTGAVVAQADQPNQPAAPVQSLSCTAQVRQIQAQPVADRVAGFYQQLRRCYETQLAAAKTANQLTQQTYTLNNLGITAYVLGDYRQALADHQQQLAVAQADKNPVGEGMALAGIGAAHSALGDYDRALTFYEQALSQLPEDQVPKWRALVLRNIGNAYLAQNQPDLAIQQQFKSLEISTKIADQYGEAQAYGNLGNAYAQKSQFTQAIDAYQKSYDIAVEIQDQLQQAQALLGLGTTHTYQRQFEQSIDYHQRSLGLMRELRAKLGEGITLTNLGDAFFRLQRLDESELMLTDAIGVWEDLRAGLGNNDAFKISIFETQLDAYRNLQETLVAQNKTGPALEIAERGRARAFIELLASRRNPDTTQPATVPPPSLDRIRQIAREQKSTIVQYSIIRDQFVPVKHGGAVQFTAEPQATAIFIWVVQPTGEVEFRQVPLNPQAGADNALALLVTDARSAIGKRQAQRGNADASATAPATSGQRQDFAQFKTLHQLLIAPIADLLPRNPADRVVFVPQEQLFLVPFAALQDAQNQFLIEQHTILTTPTIQLLGLSRPQSTANGPAPLQSPLIVGNPSPMPLGYEPLPGSATEATAIGDLLNVQPLTGAAATEASIKPQLAQAGIIHLATHGVFNEQKPLAGSLALAPSGTEDGWLTAEEMLNLSLQADLVVLSACDTGRGRITGDGVVGLSRSWMAAGVPTVLVSLWAIDDRATAGFMVEFYKSLQQQSDKAVALRSAMLKTLETNPDPDIWAAFNLIGEPD